MPGLLQLLFPALVVLFVSACGGGGGGGAPAGPEPPPPPPEFRSQAFPQERLQLDGLRVQYPGLSALGIDQAVVSDDPGFADRKPADNAQRLGEYGLAGGGKAVVWLVPESQSGGLLARAVDTPAGRFLVYVRMHVPANQWDAVVAANQAPLVFSSPSVVTECAAGLVLAGGECQIPVSCGDSQFRNAAANRCESLADCGGSRFHNATTNQCEPFKACGPNGEQRIYYGAYISSQVLNRNTNQCECPLEFPVDTGKIFEGNPDNGTVCERMPACNYAGGQIYNRGENLCECPPDMSYTYQTDAGVGCAAVHTCTQNIILTSDDSNYGCACPPGMERFATAFGEDSYVCKVPKQCAGGFPPNVYNECRLLCPDGMSNVDNKCRLSCPEGMSEEECERRRWEYEASPASRIAGMDRARVLGLTGKGVTIAVGELSNPYWVDDCGVKTMLEWVVIKYGEREPSARPNEDVPARYANYENWRDCQRGLLRTSSDLPSIRVVRYPNDFTEPETSSQVHYNSSRDHVAHVNAVFGVLAAQENHYGVVGVAPQASYVYAHYLHNWDNSPDVEIVNFSVGGGGPITDEIVYQGGLVATMATREKLRNDQHIGHLLSHADVVSNPADRRIYVNAAGNESYDNLYVDVGGVYFFPELWDTFLAVVAVEGGNIAGYSNRCGLAGASFCLAAPVGGWLMSPDIVGDFFSKATGTSIAAPQVVGALALVKEYFNRMGGIGSHELVRRIKATADKSGVYADESIYGAGLLDLGSALSPVGALRLRSGESVWDGGGVLLSESGLFSGEALGDSAFRALRGMTLAAFDDLDAPFPISSETVLRGSSRARLGGGLGSHLRRWQVGDLGSGAFSFSDFRDGSAWWSLNAPGDSHFDWGEGSFGGEDSPAIFSDWVGNPYSGLAGRGLVAGSSFRLSGGNDFRMAMFGESLGNEKRFRGVLAEFSFSPFADGSGEGEGSRWFAQAGGVREYSGLLASSGSGLFSDLNSRTAFAGLGFAGGLPDGWRYRFGAHWGRTSADGAWLTATDSLRSGSYAAGLERSDVFRSGDGLGFRIRQPLRVSGGLKFRVPTGRTKYGELTWSEVSGVPSGRELEWEARYRRPYEGGHWGMSAVLVSESGHRSGAKTEGRALFAFERNF